MSNLLVRTITGSIYVAVILSGLFHPCLFPIVFSIAAGLTLWEFYGLIRRHSVPSFSGQLAGTIGGIYLFAASFVYVNAWSDSRIFLPYLLFLLFVFISEMYAQREAPLSNWAFMLLGQVYCAAPFALLNGIVFQPGDSFPVRFVSLPALALFVFVWLNDSGAYLIGSKLGRHRLFERISPKKSWEGFFGGLFVVLIASQIFAFYIPAISWFHWLGMSAIIVVFATWGDLVESLLKRSLGVKDSGALLPGHGGMLDRFDSILLALPALYLYLQLFIQN
ncbi:MAG: phosphatidate cytidylyltransferase [Tannerellaceae bacterium]|nr:phosphatidate cytidylyltransferase [Tannerellaceae bacterium]